MVEHQNLDDGIILFSTPVGVFPITIVLYYVCQNKKNNY